MSTERSIAGVASPVELHSREWFAAAAAGFVEIAEVVGAGPVERLDDPALGEWTVRDLIGHASRAFRTLEDYLDAAPTHDGSPRPDRRVATAQRHGPRLASAAAYLEAARRELADPAAVRERGRAAGLALGARPHEAVVALAQRVMALVASAPGDATVTTPVGRIDLRDYLPTRAFELTVHGLDLARAVGERPPAALRVALRPALHFCADVITGDDRMIVLLALTGRTALPYRFSLV